MNTQAETRLWTAVLSRAILDLDIPEESTKSFAWIRSPEEFPGSFVFVADVLNQEPAQLRRQIIQWHTQKTRSFQYAA
ncbi:MAG: hypothetical protein HQL87_11165 [Magnetococcales bacterium]|nr:hypothetical protein [Magnetococcales bacterium]